MTQILHLANSGDIEKLLPMIEAYHALEGIGSDADHRRAAVTPLLDGSPHGAVWLIGPKMSPVGYIAVTFGWSIEMGGLDGFIDELWIREKVRGRGMGSEAVQSLIKSLKSAGLMALHLEVGPENTRAQKLYRKLGFDRRPFNLMTWRA